MRGERCPKHGLVCELDKCPKCMEEDNVPRYEYSLSGMRIERRPWKCPVCNGAGTVSRPPNIAGDQETWSASGTPVYPCKSCQGTGVVWEPL